MFAWLKGQNKTFEDVIWVVENIMAIFIIFSKYFIDKTIYLLIEKIIGGLISNENNHYLQP